MWKWKASRKEKKERTYIHVIILILHLSAMVGFSIAFLSAEIMMVRYDSYGMVESACTTTAYSCDEQFRGQE